MEDGIPKITYLFGAGASAQKLPTIKQLPERIKHIKEFVQNNYNFDETEEFSVKTLKVNKNEAKKFVLDGLDKLFDASSNHSTVDTYAKKLFLNGRRQETNELAFFLAFYFNIEQKLAGTDPRYNTFLISILDYSAQSFPNNLKFLSWNYDLQLEMAYSDLLDRRITELDFGYFNTSDRYWEKSKFTSVKINGSCTCKGRFDDAFPLVNNIRDRKPEIGDIDFSLQYGLLHIKNRQRVYDTNVNIDFAWYKESNFIANISEIYDETQVLVVIGYSFPFFNREVDRKIIRAMYGLRKIYIQDLYPDNIISRFLSILPDYKKRNIEIIPINSVDEFFLPPEL
jgi:hypothetical protein